MTHSEKENKKLSPAFLAVDRTRDLTITMSPATIPLSHTPSFAFRHLPPDSVKNSLIIESACTPRLRASVHRRCRRPRKGLDCNDFGFICDGYSKVDGYKSNAWCNPSCPLHSQHHITTATVTKVLPFEHQRKTV